MQSDLDLLEMERVRAEATRGSMQVTADPYEDGTPYFRFRIGDGDYDDETRHGAQFTSIMSPEDAGLIAALWNNRDELIAAARERDRLREALREIANGEGEERAIRDPAGGIIDALPQPYSARQMQAIASAALGDAP